MYFEVGESVVVCDPSPRLLQWCKEEATVPNPDYDKKVKMGLWTGNTPREISLYEVRSGNLVLPFGYAKKLKEMFPDVPILSRIKAGAAFDYDSGINLYPYQERAVLDALEAKNGIIVMPCGAGKTQAGLEVVSRIGVRTLWLTHTQDLLNQSLNRAKSVLGCRQSAYGTITGGRVKIGEGLTFATVQTMARLDLPKYRDIWRCVIVDECHKAVGSPTRVMQFYRVLSNLNCRYKFGLTATPKRADGLEKTMFALLGDVCCTIGRDAVEDTTCPVKVRRIPVDYFPDMGIVLAGDGTLNYSMLMKDLTENKARFDMVLDEILSLPRQPVLILGSRVEYLERLASACNKGGRKAVCLSSLSNTKAGKEKRKQVLSLLNEGEKVDTVLATYQLAKEGLDVPNLRYLVMATPEKDETTVVQSAGRVGRKYPGKDFGEVLDFRDSFGMFAGWGKKRDYFYRKLSYELY